MKKRPKRELRRRDDQQLHPNKPSAGIPYVKVAALLLLFLGLMLLAKYALANGDSHNSHDRGGDTQTVNNTYIKDGGDDDAAKFLIGTAVGMCIIYPAVKSYVIPAVVGLFTWSHPRFGKWFWCWPDDAPPEPLPSPGPAVKQADPIKIEFIPMRAGK